MDRTTSVPTNSQFQRFFSPGEVGGILFSIFFCRVFVAAGAKFNKFFIARLRTKDSSIL